MRIGRNKAVPPVYANAAMLRLITVLLLSVVISRAATNNPKTIVFFGDSITAGYGLEDTSLAFPARIQKKIDEAKLPYHVVNAGLSGDTTAGGLRRIDWVLKQPIDVFVLELGGNDGLRGLSPVAAQQNLQTIINKVRVKNPNAKIVLTGMYMPTSMGEEYTKAFAAIFPKLAEQNSVTFVPFLLENVGGVSSLNQPDQIHPNAEGHAIIAETIWKQLKPLLANS
jgi:acyl-CoA thioesterase I